MTTTDETLSRHEGLIESLLSAVSTLTNRGPSVTAEVILSRLNDLAESVKNLRAAEAERRQTVEARITAVEVRLRAVEAAQAPTAPPAADPELWCPRCKERRSPHECLPPPTILRCRCGTEVQLYSGQAALAGAYRCPVCGTRAESETEAAALGHVGTRICRVCERVVEPL